MNYAPLKHVLDRANNPEKDELKRQRDQWMENATRLRHQVRDLQREIDELRAKLEQFEGITTPATAPKMIDNRPVITVAEAVKRTGIKYHTITRYCRQEYWESRKVGNQWMIFTDQSLTKK